MQWLSDTIAAITGDSAPPSEQNPAASLQSSGTLLKQQLQDFFLAGEQLLKAEDTRRRLKDAKLLKQDVEELVNQLQKNIFEKQGINGDFGIGFLGQVSTVYKDDNQIMASLLQFAALEEDALDEAELPEEEYAQKQRLMELAKAHTAQLMAKLEELPEDQRQGFLQDQMLRAEQLRRSAADEQSRPSSQTQGSTAQSMTQEDRLSFFRDLQR